MNKAQLSITEEEFLDEIQLSDFLLLGIDISEEEAISLRLPIRVGFNGERFIWCDDIDPK